MFTFGIPVTQTKKIIQHFEASREMIIMLIMIIILLMEIIILMLQAVMMMTKIIMIMRITIIITTVKNDDDKDSNVTMK